MAPVTVPKTFTCGICSSVLASQRALDNHMCVLHDDCGEAPLRNPITFRCAVCGEAFARRDDLIVHLGRRGHGHPSEGDASRPARAKRPRRQAGSGAGS
jgi:uncharacterized C2H2 Zn-finger protein